MIEQIEKLKQIIEDTNIASAAEAEQFRLRYLSKKGEVSVLFDLFKELTGEEKRAVGKPLNVLKQLATDKWNNARTENGTDEKTKLNNLDLTLPGFKLQQGARHPLSIVKNEIVEIFAKMGFTLSEGPEIEDDWHNFTALNFPLEHPARDMQDTFFIEHDQEMLLRTHTSTVQVRVLEQSQPPIRTISPGRVFRNEAISARAHCIFHQVEAMYVDKDVSFADLKHTLLSFAREMFGEATKIRLRPSYFPFTEPSAEVDISCTVCGGEGCNICKHTGWVEIMGCGMFDPNVLKNCGIDPDVYSGFAMGMGIERITMLKYQIKDLRLFFQNDIRFIQQFGTAW